MPTRRERFDAKTAPGPDGCIDWTGGTTRGYGQFWNGDRVMPAPRWIWEAEHGPIPDGLTIDHLCRRPICVNPGHMEIVTRAENARRGNVDAYAEGCKAGHPWTDESTYWRSDGRRECRICGKLRQRARSTPETRAIAAARARARRALAR